MDQETALRVIDASIAMLKLLRLSKPFTPKHVEFVQTTRLELARIFGPDSIIAKNFSEINYQTTEQFLTDLNSYGADKKKHDLQAYMRGLNIADGVLTSARTQLERHGVDRVLSESRIKAEGAKVFVSHGKETAALAKVERFVRALGLSPVIVVRGASEGMSVDALVEKRLGECDCAIILATSDDKVGDYYQPRPNVIHEIGLAQERLANRIVYLKEVGCEFPSNVRPKVWENFTQDNMEAAFEKISKELRAFSML